MNIVNKNPNLIPELQNNPPFTEVKEADGTIPWNYIGTNADGNKWVQYNSFNNSSIKEVTAYQQIIDGDAGYYILTKSDSGYPLNSEFIKKQNGDIVYKNDAIEIKARFNQLNVGSNYFFENNILKNKPTEEPIEVIDPSIEEWTNNTTPTNLTKIEQNGATIKQESTEVHDRQFSAKLQPNTNGGRVALIYPHPTIIPVGDFIKSSIFVKTPDVNTSFRVRNDNQLHSEYSTILTDGIWQEIQNVSFKKVNSGGVFFQSYGNTNKTFYIDDIKISKLKKSSLFVLTKELENIIKVKAYLKPNKEGSVCGIVYNLDNLYNPQNYILLLKDNTNQLFLWKCVNGVMTQVGTELVYGNESNHPEGLVELKKINSTDFQILFDGIPTGNPYTINEPTILNNKIFGIITTDKSNECLYFSASDNIDIVDVPNGADLDLYSKFLSRGDIMRLFKNGEYDLGNKKGFYYIPNGSTNERIVIDGNNATIIGGLASIWLEKKSYLDFYNLNLKNPIEYFTFVINGSNNITFNSIKGNSNTATFRDCFKNRSAIPSLNLRVTDLEYNDCEATCTNGLTTVDGFEDWGTKNITYRRCKAYNMKNGILDYNNGHGFETYGGNTTTPEPCENITYIECEADNCRVGFSSEGGIPQVLNINVRAINCTSKNMDIADAGGVNGSQLKITKNTLLNRTGNVIEL